MRKKADPRPPAVPITLARQNVQLYPQVANLEDNRPSTQRRLQFYVNIQTSEVSEQGRKSSPEREVRRFNAGQLHQIWEGGNRTVRGCNAEAISSEGGSFRCSGTERDS